MLNKICFHGEKAFLIKPCPCSSSSKYLRSKAFCWCIVCFCTRNDAFRILKWTRKNLFLIFLIFQNQIFKTFLFDKISTFWIWVNLATGVRGELTLYVIKWLMISSPTFFKSILASCAYIALWLSIIFFSPVLFYSKNVTFIVRDQTVFHSRFFFSIFRSYNWKKSRWTGLSFISLWRKLFITIFLLRSFF